VQQLDRNVGRRMVVARSNCSRIIVVTTALQGILLLTDSTRVDTYIRLLTVFRTGAKINESQISHLDTHSVSWYKLIHKL